MKVLHLTRDKVDALGPAAALDALAAHDTAILWGSEEHARLAQPPPAPDLDLRGEVCPFTFVRTKLRLEEMGAGERLRVIVDHEPASRNIPRSAREWGQTILHVGPIGPGVWQILIEKARNQS